MAMQLIYANPSPTKKKRKPSTPRRKRAAAKGAPMARKKVRRRRRVHARAATSNPAPRRRRRRAVARRRVAHHNPFRSHRRRYRRNPSSVGGGSLLKELMSKEGLIMIAAGVAGATVPVMLQAKFMPNLTGYTKTAARAAVAVAGAWALQKFVSRKAGMAFAITGLASAVSEVVNTYQANSVIQPVTAQQQAVADSFAENPSLMDNLLSLNGGYENVPRTLAGGYAMTPLGAAPYMDAADTDYTSLN